MNCLPYRVINASTGFVQHQGRIGFDTAALIKPGGILNIPEGRFVTLKTEIDLNGPEAELTIYVSLNKHFIIETSKQIAELTPSIDSDYVVVKHANRASFG
jgi:hypothetical protein